MSKNNFVDASSPQWLNGEFFQNILRSCENDPKIKVISVSCGSVTENGENYASVMYRVSVNYLNHRGDRKMGSFIVKCSHNNEQMSKKFSKYEVFGTEIGMYNEIGPEVENILKSINDNTNLFPRIQFIDHENNIIVFEDLSLRGYKNADRLARLDLVHAEMVLEKLAKLHAVSVILQERHPHLFDKYNTGMFNRKTSEFESIFISHLTACIQEVSEWKGYEKFIPKLEKIKNELNERGCQTFDPLPDDFNVLIHGDLWTNNFMYKYSDENQPMDMLLIDLQFSCWASPMVDLQYFFHSSLKEDLRQNNIDELVQYYHSCLVDMLTKLNTTRKIPSLLDLQIQMLKKGFCAFISAVLLQPMMIVEDTKNVDLNSKIRDNEAIFQFKRMIYRNPKVEKSIKYLLPLLDSKGLLD